MLLSILDLVGIAVFAASGALVGIAKRLDVFGVSLVGVTTGIGGGIVRDVLLGIHPPTSLQNWQNFSTALGACVVVLFFHPEIRRIRPGVLVLDAIGVGVFATGGAAIALSHGAGPLASTLIGATAAIGGGVIRDVLVNEMPLLLHRDLYAVPAILGAAIVTVGNAVNAPSVIALTTGVIVAAGLRLLALWRGWNLPIAPRITPQNE
ncbi:trimeric intracellular cation channel family protein [Hoyosella rhizosphaerae]|uniref:Membrane protein n=1 Tax=Hoyosella rhizosphaerae TaxID=1755582 RepID=A0A916UD80_9ACTN|nr:trimeric intracellular cation channel family protein [Hoyosella rhizosphaerae]MBN4925788.1 trimeric intracellular cation channel family protein [Hoyosella rhizosphaerae]GGC67958.1 membrane protein [Hoyosella rhizosphaerae]